MVQECILTIRLLGSPKLMSRSGRREQREAGLPVSNGDALQEVAELEFWRDRLSSAPKELALPVDRPYSGEPVRAWLARPLPAADELTLLAAFTVLLSRYAGTADVLLGIGSLVPLRVDLGGSPGFAEVVERVRAAREEALAHEVPFADLVAEVAPEHGRGVRCSSASASAPRRTSRST